MSLYPKQPFGPSAPGAAGVRALDSVGGNWQRKQGVGYTAKLMGEFRRVETGGFEYLTEGRTRVTPSAPTSFAGFRYQLPFAPSAITPGAEYIGRAAYFQYAALQGSSVTVPYTYTVTGAPARSIPYTNVAYPTEIQGEYLSAFGGANERGVFDIEHHDHFYDLGVYAPARIRAPTFAYLGDLVEPADRVVFSGALAPGSRVDPAGRTLPDLAVFAWYREAKTLGFTLSVGGPLTEFLPYIPSIATRNHGMLLVMERLFVNEVYGSASSYRPAIRLLRINGKEITSISAFNVTGLLNADGYTPPPQPGNSLVAGLEADFISVASNELRFLNAMNNDMMSLVQLCAVTLDRVVMAYTALVADPGWSSVDYRYRYRVAVIDLGALTINLTVNEPLSGIPGTAGDGRKHIQNMIHLGDDVVLAKQVADWKGTGHAVKFLRSEDAGFTWAELAPTGLESAMVNQFFGDFTLHRAYSAGPPEAPGVVLLPAWSEPEQAYFVFESADAGESWTRRGRIARPDAFYRVDAMLAGDGGGNFRRLLPGPDLLRPADLAQPDRFNP